MVFCIEKFSSSLSFAYATALSLDDLPAACFELTDDTEVIIEVIYKLSDLFGKELNSIAEKIAEEDIWKPFTKAFLSRCIIISDEPCYLSFLLLCSLIETTVGAIFIDSQCFTYAIICCLCLRIVYERCYKDLFNEIQEFESLGSFCRSINPLPVEGESKLILSVDEQREISFLLSNAVDIDYNNFIITDSELKILHKTINIMARKNFRPNPFEPMDMCCECDFSSDHTMDVEEVICVSSEGKEVDCVSSEGKEVDCVSSEGNQVDCVSSEEEEECSFGENQICDLCGGKCFRFLVLYRSEMRQQELSADNDRTQSLDDLPSTCFELAYDTEAVLGVIDKLSDMFEKQLNSIAENIQDASECDFELFMDAFLSRCLIISDEPSYLSFLLLCSLIVNTAHPIFIDLQCLTYAMICCLCLRIVYEKCYKDLFDENEESESLDSYCRSINPCFVEEENQILLSVQQQFQISLLLSKAVNMDYNNFMLTNSDMGILHKTINILTMDDFLLNTCESTDMCCESDSSSTDTMDVEDETDSFSSDECEDFSSRENQKCGFCGGKCFRYLVLYRSETLRQELSVDNGRCNCNG
ncbi:hypothetical protein HNY73_008753 [Argiope bruennichi]|uniref:Uncharacterized protein n=1 Tax=Argiope bruennichi TaxID=94029 RepID=A0A8T0FA80_ARGBR|nr:hypothetical protein HNY73_008753 [Argiope bruennichi]